MEHKEKSDVVEINIGVFKRNIWLIVSIILALLLVYFAFFKSAGITGSVSGDAAAQKLISFINSQGNGEAKLVSVSQKGTLYEIVVNYQDQDIPVFVTLDGNYLITSPVPLSDDAPALGDTADTGATPGEKVDVEIGDSPVLGNKSAKVVIVEFTDYECPFCGRHFSETFSQIKKDYIDTGKVLYVLKDFPLISIHSEAQKAAEAAHCVRDQLKDTGYWKMHDKLFENQQSLSVENEKKWARELGVQGATFDSCLDSGKHAKTVTDSTKYGESLGVSGTPNSFINGLGLSGAYPYSDFKNIIDSELAK